MNITTFEEKQQTMTSSQLAEMLGFESKSSINKAIRKMFDDSKLESFNPSLDSRGYVVDYHLPELESKMFVAKHDINYLQKITEFWISKGKSEQPSWLSDLSPQAKIALEDLSNQLNGVNLTKVNAKLVELGVLNFSYGRLSVASRVRGDYFKELPTKGYEDSQGKTIPTFKIEVLKRGAKWIYSKYLKGELPMKKSWNGSFTHDKELNF